MAILAQSTLGVFSCSLSGQAIGLQGPHCLLQDLAMPGVMAGMQRIFDEKMNEDVLSVCFYNIRDSVSAIYELRFHS